MHADEVQKQFWTAFDKIIIGIPAEHETTLVENADKATLYATYFTMHKMNKAQTIHKCVEKTDGRSQSVVHHCTARVPKAVFLFFSFTTLLQYVIDTETLHSFKKHPVAV